MYVRLLLLTIIFLWKYIDIFINKKNLFVRALETGKIASLRRALQACFAASTNEFYI
jgi:hypothetical protein